MSKPFDASLKDLIESYPADWLTLLGLQTDAPVRPWPLDYLRGFIRWKHQ